MTAKQSKSLGGKQLLKAGAILFAVYELTLLYKQTRGDFANGLLFFIAEQANIYFALFFTLYFTLMYTTGRLAGYCLLIKGWASVWTVLLYSLVTALITVAMFQLTVSIVLRNEPQVLSESDVVEIYITTFVGLFVALLCLWSWAVYKIKRKGVIL